MIARTILITSGSALATVLALSRTARHPFKGALSGVRRPAQAPITVSPRVRKIGACTALVLAWIVLALVVAFFLLAMSSDPVYWGG